MTGGKTRAPRHPPNVSGQMRSSDTHKAPSGAPNRVPALGLFRVSKHAKAKQPKPKP